MLGEVAQSSDLWVNLGVLIAAAIAVLAGYIGPKVFGAKGAAATGRTDPVLTGIGLAYGDHVDRDRLDAKLERIAVALEVLADRRQTEMDDKLDDLLERLPDRTGPPRRRPTRRRIGNKPP